MPENKPRNKDWVFLRKSGLTKLKMKIFRLGVQFNALPRRLGLIAHKCCDAAVKDWRALVQLLFYSRYLYLGA
jgi:hypothetical protein